MTKSQNSTGSVVVGPDTVAIATRSTGSRKPLSMRMLTNPLGVISIVYLIAVFVIAVIGPFFLPHDPNLSRVGDVFAPPGDTYLLGADGAGRDVLSRVVVATGISLAGAALAILVALVVGVPAGLVAGYRGGFIDEVISWIASLFLALPGMVVLLAARSVIGPSIWTIMVIFGVLISPSYYRVVFGAVRSVRSELYVDAARVAGLSDVRIVGRHVLSAVRAPVILLTTGMVAVAIGIQAAMDFLGLGDPNLATWGGMLSEGFRNIYVAPTLLVTPTLAIGLTCIAFTLFGVALRDELEHAGDQKQRKKTSWTRDVPAAPEPVRHMAAADVTALPEPSDPLLNVEGLSVAYPTATGWKTVVNEVSLAVRPGEVHALIGESGSGKTQTAWSILGLLPEGGTVVGGRIRMDGKDLVGARSAVLDELRGRVIGYIPQEPLSNLDPCYTVGHQLVEPMRVVLGMSKAAARAKALDLLEQVGIVDPRRTFSAYPHEISGGMAQRVLIAGAVSCDPALIVADEPTTALDVTVQAEILGLLRRMQQETGAGLLLVTHNFGVVADLADTVSVMRAGSIVETGSVRDLFRSPTDTYTRTLFGSLLSDAPARETFVESRKDAR